MTRPNILVIAGHDPSGGAGIQADIESAAANGAHAATVVTLLTCQDTADVYGVSPVEIDFFRRCLNTALADMSFGAIKIGVVADVAQVAAVAELVQARPEIPLVVDPVLRAAGGGTLAGDAVGQALRDRLFPHAAVVTPNAGEARLLCDGEPDLARCGERLSRAGSHALITGGDEGSAAVVNHGFVDGRLARTYEWPRVAGVFHGSGCTLASAIAARLACGDATDQALAHAQDYTWRAIEHGFAAGRGQRIPDRRPVP